LARRNTRKAERLSIVGVIIEKRVALRDCDARRVKK